MFFKELNPWHFQTALFLLFNVISSDAQAGELLCPITSVLLSNCLPSSSPLLTIQQSFFTSITLICLFSLLHCSCSPSLSLSLLRLTGRRNSRCLVMVSKNLSSAWRTPRLASALPFSSALTPPLLLLLLHLHLLLHHLLGVLVGFFTGWSDNVAFKRELCRLWLHTLLTVCFCSGWWFIYGNTLLVLLTTFSLLSSTTGPSLLASVSICRLTHSFICESRLTAILISTSWLVLCTVH